MPLISPATISSGITPKKRLFRHCHFTKHEPLSVSYGIGIPEHDHEGRVITLEYDAFIWLPVTLEFPERTGKTSLPHAVGRRFSCLSEKYSDEVKPVIVCGDLNVAHEEIDLKNQNQPQKS